MLRDCLSLKIILHLLALLAYHGTFVAANNITFVCSVDNKPSNLARNSARNLLAGSELEP